jgi:hypothetical protein
MGLYDKFWSIFFGGRIWLLLLAVLINNLLSTDVLIRCKSLSNSLVAIGGDDWLDMTAVFMTAVVPLFDSDIALSLKFEFVSCSWEVLDVIDVVTVDWRDNKWLAKRDEIRLMRASSSFAVGDDDDRIDEMNGCCTSIFVGVFNSISTEFNCGDINNDVDDGRSEVEPSPVVESGKLLPYCIEQKKKSITYLIKLFLFGDAIA